MEKFASILGLVLVSLLLSLGQQEADCLKMKVNMIHRHSPHSPLYREFSSKHERLQELLHLDSVRIRSKNLGNSDMNMNFQPAAAPPPDQTPFYMKLASGATLGAALYFVELYIGTPPQRVLPIADTGSDHIWVNCNGRSSPNITEFPVFNPDNSSTLSYVPCYSRDCYAVSPALDCIFRPKRACKYTYEYLDNSSSSGPYIQDTITLVSTSGQPFKTQKMFMGCGVDSQGQNQVGSGGILGLGQGFNSFASQASSLYGYTFSYCLADYLQPTTLKTPLFFGKRNENPKNPNLLLQSVQYTPILKGNSSYYHVGIENVRINGEILPISSSLWEMDEAGNGGTIIDSGSSLTYFVEEAYEVIMEALKFSTVYPKVSTRSPQRFDLCFNVSGVSDPKFPEISIELKGGLRFTPSAENYMLEIEDGVRCVGFNPLGDLSIIGNIFQQNFFIEYDRGRSLLGIAPANCSLITA